MSETEHVVCPHCAGVNRVPATAKALAAKCGVCGERLFSGHPADVDGTMFERQVARSTIPSWSTSGRPGAAPAGRWRRPTRPPRGSSNPMCA